MLQNSTECRSSQILIRSFKNNNESIFKKVFKRSLQTCRAHTSTVEVATGAEKPGLCWHLAEPHQPGRGCGCRAQTYSVRSQQPTFVEKRLEAAGFPSLTLQTQGLSDKETGEVSRRMMHSRAHWKCLHLIIKVLKDMALFQKTRKLTHCEIPTLSKISPDISEWSFTDIFTEVCSFLAGKNLTPLFNHVTPHFHWLSLFPFSWFFPWCKYTLQ